MPRVNSCQGIFRRGFPRAAKEMMEKTFYCCRYRREKTFSEMQKRNKRGERRRRRKNSVEECYVKLEIKTLWSWINDQIKNGAISKLILFITYFHITISLIRLLYPNYYYFLQNIVIFNLHLELNFSVTCNACRNIMRKKYSTTA